MKYDAKTQSHLLRCCGCGVLESGAVLSNVEQLLVRCLFVAAMREFPAALGPDAEAVLEACFCLGDSMPHDLRIRGWKLQDACAFTSQG